MLDVYFLQDRRAIVLAKVTVTVGAGIATILSTARMAFAASTGMSLSPEYNEILRLAQQKVLAAIQRGAFGNGFPMLYSAEPMMLVP